jgi:hypothetical protein
MLDFTAVKAVKVDLLIAESITKIHWQAIAAVWFRESSWQNIRNPFQFDPIPSWKFICSLVEEYIEPVYLSEIKPMWLHDFPSAAIIAGCWLRHKCRYIIPPTNPDILDETIYADAFYGYNGRAFGADPLNSPYVANMLDSLHMDMHFRGTVNGKWIDIIDKRPGALTVYRQLIRESI